MHKILAVWKALQCFALKLAGSYVKWHMNKQNVAREIFVLCDISINPGCPDLGMSRWIILAVLLTLMIGFPFFRLPMGASLY